MKVVFGSVIYREALKYLDDFFSSVQSQTYQDFELLLINDNISMDILEKFQDKYPLIMKKTKIITKEVKTQPYQLRVELLLEAYRMDGQLLVMGDCDDRFSRNRIAKIVDGFDDRYAFYYNKLLGWQGQEVLPEFPRETGKIEDIGEENYLGLSNTAINMEKMSVSFLESLYEGKTNIFDWYLYTRILLIGEKGKYIEQGCTYYRIHEQNLAGISQTSVDDIYKEIGIKVEHYRLLRHYNPYFNEKLDKYLQMNADDINLNVNTGMHFWWGLVK